MTLLYYTPPPVIPFDPFSKRRTFPFMDRVKVREKANVVRI